MIKYDKVYLLDARFKNKEESGYQHIYTNLFYNRSEAIKNGKHFFKHAMIEYLKEVSKFPKKEILEDLDDFVHEYIDYVFDIIVYSTEKQTSGSLRDVINDLVHKYKNETLYQKILSYCNYDEQHYRYDGKFLCGQMTYDNCGVSFFSEEDFKPNNKYKYSNGDIVRVIDRGSNLYNGIYIINGNIDTIYNSKNPIDWSSHYTLEGIDKNGNYSYCDWDDYYRDIHLESANIELAPESFLYKLREVILGKRKISEDDQSLLDGGDIITNTNKVSYLDLESFK